MLRFAICCVATLLPVAALSAQDRPPRERPALTCNMSQRIVGVMVVDRVTGAPVEGATVTATRVRTKAVVQQAAAMGTPGLYFIAQDGDVPGLTRAGEPLRILVTKGDRRVTAVYTLGLDERGCHVDLRGPKEIKL